MVSDTDENKIKLQIETLPFDEQVIHLAKAKAISISKQHFDKFVIGGDQMCLENKVLHKPGSKENAIRNGAAFG